MKRPAETVTGGLGAGAAIGAAFAGNWEQFVTAIILGVLPGVVTGIVELGGCQGIYEKLRWGRRK